MTWKPTILEAGHLRCIHFGPADLLIRYPKRSLLNRLLDPERKQPAAHITYSRKPTERWGSPADLRFQSDASRCLEGGFHPNSLPLQCR